MNVRDVVLFASLVAGALLAGSCSGPDPGAIEYRERLQSPVGGSSGTPGGTDGGGSSGEGGPPPDPVFGTSTFAYVNPGQNANAANAAHQNTVEGKNCIQAGCHLDGNQPWAFGGTVYTGAANSTTTATNVEIRVTAPNGTEFGHTYTDANGNFWLSTAGRPPAGSRVGVRNATTKQLMVGTVEGNAGAGCNAGGTCHGNAAMRIYL